MATSEQDIWSEFHDLVVRCKKEYGIHTYAPESDSPLVNISITEQLEHTCLKISWSNANAGILLGFEREGSFAPLEAEFNELENGICIIQSRAGEGFVTRELKPGIYYCYHIFFKVKNKRYVPPNKTSPADILKKFFTRVVTGEEYFNYEVAHFSRQLPVIDLQAELNKKLQVLRTLTDIASQEKVLAQKTAPEKSPEEQRKEKIERSLRILRVDIAENIKGLFEIMQERDFLMDEVSRKRQSGEIKTDREMTQLSDLIKDQYTALIEDQKGR